MSHPEGSPRETRGPTRSPLAPPSHIETPKVGVGLAIQHLSIRGGPVGWFVVPYERIAPYLSDADVLIGAIDPDDVPFVALALAEDHDGIWSNDRAFEDLPGIQHWTTASLKTHLRL